MKVVFTIGYISIASFLALGSCSKANLKNSDEDADFGLLAGTWMDAESYALQFIEFQSTDRGRFGTLSRQSKEYSPFHYTLADSLLTIRFDGHDDFPQSTHKLYSRGADTLTISDLTVIPENPDKVYVRQRLVTERKGDTIVIGLGDTYYDAEHDFRIRVDSLLGDSRCPEGVQCVWAGNAGVRFEIIAAGNYRHLFDLNTHGGAEVPTRHRNQRHQVPVDRRSTLSQTQRPGRPGSERGHQVIGDNRKLAPLPWAKHTASPGPSVVIPA